VQHLSPAVIATSLTLLALSTACASGHESTAAPRPASAAELGICAPELDVVAIRAMAGSYDVGFSFEETDVLTAGYRKREIHRSAATELVALVEDTPRRLSLQHVLVVGGGVVKHWRQDWTFEDRELLEFRGRGVWERRTVPAEAVRCTWSQAVFAVDDSPRYEGYGRWVHDARGSVWASNETWRPLPRREYTTRSDYDVLVAVNRHRITASGWEHEQDNVKLVLEPRHLLVRERGSNGYTRTKATETAPAASYWQSTAPFWKEVRAEWARVLASHQRLRLRVETGNDALHEPLFARATATGAADEASTVAFIHDAIGSYLLPPSPVTVAVEATAPR
jgi:hypothetical protein